MANEFDGFDPTLMRYLKQLKRNNNRDWFKKNKSRYETELLEPCQQFIRAFQPHLKKFSQCFVASDKRVGGSLMRIYRDTRFSKDKTPYKINVGIHFRHTMYGESSAPILYLHLAPDESFLAAGVWHPDSESIKKIRQAIDGDSAKWKRTRDNKKFRSVFELEGESLKSGPRGFDKEHPLLEDLKRKDHVGVHKLNAAEFESPEFVDSVAKSFAASRPYMKFLCEALQLPF